MEFANISCCKDQSKAGSVNAEFHTFFTENHGSEITHSMESVSSEHTHLPTNSASLSTEQDVTRSPHKTLFISNDDVSKCISEMSSLNLTADDVITLFYIQHKKSLALRGGMKTDSTHVQHTNNSSEMTTCSILIEAPPGKALSILFLNQTCSRDNEVRVQDNHDGWNTTLDGCSPWMSPGYDVTTADRSAVMEIVLHNLTDFFKLKVQFNVISRDWLKRFITRYVSPVLGYIQTPGWHPFGRSFGGAACDTTSIVIPKNQMTLISVVYSCWSVPSNRSPLNVELFTISEAGGKARRKWGFSYGKVNRPDEVLLANLTEFRMKLQNVHGYFFNGIRVLFSFHQPLLAPKRHPGGLWNCSVPSWPYFRLHFVCNYKTECAGREDEMGCAGTSCQQGGMLLNGICYIIIRLPEKRSTWHHADAACKTRGATLATFPTVDSWYHLALLSQIKKADEHIYIGLHSPQAGYPYIIVCPDHHRTQDFLACDAFTACWRNNDESSSYVYVTADNAVTPDCMDVDEASFLALFPCQNGAGSVPYSLVCNHLQDCADNSDEDFCVFPSCSAESQYMCANGQCLQFLHHCDNIIQCVDESDEADCTAIDVSPLEASEAIVRPRPPAVADFDGHGFMVYTPLGSGTVKGAMVCPDTHVFCPGDGYCLPVYVRCNGLLDCPGREDEDDCDSYTCAGLYRCRGLLDICLHPDHLCDGWPQCSQHDDELFCNLTCPANCTCLGHAFTCFGDIHVEPLSRLCYLDAGGTGLEPERLANNLMLVYLSLARCNLAHLGNLTLPNLRSLDLRGNRFSRFAIAEINLLKNLQNLSLAGNPVTIIFSGDYSSGFLKHEQIRHVDLTGVELRVLDMPSYLPFPSLLSLNLSQSGVTRLMGDGFQSLTFLRTLDLRGCPMTIFPRHVFGGLKHLRLVFADNHKLCCKVSLPEGFNLANCQAPLNEISSCEALLRADVYRVCLSVLAALALSGNMGCFCVRIFSLTGRGKTGFNVFVTHLCVSDFVMGVYMAMIGVADRLYLGRYLWEEDTWRHSAACQVAGVLALLSSEVSAFIICLITLDRFLVIRFPFSRLRFSSFSAQVASLLTWIVGVAQVTVPLLPVTAYLHFYGQTGICVPLPITRNNIAGQHYGFGVMILLNLVVFLMIATGQISVYLSMTSNAMSSIDTTRKSRDLIVARRLITVVVSDFLCWFPLGLLGVLAAQGVPVPGEVNVAMAIFVLPLNSALNPFLYTVNMVQEKRQRATEVKMLKMIMDLGINDDENVNTK